MVSHSLERVRELEARVMVLEERIRRLRSSRRVLMDLLTVRERERKARLLDLELENQRLRRRNGHYARHRLSQYIQQARQRLS